MTRSCFVEQLHSRRAVHYKDRVGLRADVPKSASPSDASGIFIPHTTSYGRLLANHLSPNMGRKPWATPPQLEFLHSRVPGLARAKKDGGLTKLYSSTAQEFFEKWGAEPIVSANPNLSPKELERKARKRLERVGIFFDMPWPRTHGHYQRVTNWFKERRKEAKRLASGNPLRGTRPRFDPLDLTGRSRRKTRPYQLYQAFSILYWRPPESPLRQELNELWERRHEESVSEMLSPFLEEAVESSTSTSEKFVFHVAVMRWKVSTLADEELDVLRSWIKGQQKLKEQARVSPWMQEADEYDDALFAENAHIQRYVIRTLMTMTSVDELHKTAVSIAFHQRCKQRSMRSNGTQASKLWSSSGASNPGRAQFLVTCEPPSRTPPLPLFSLTFFLAMQLGRQSILRRHSTRSIPR